MVFKHNKLPFDFHLAFECMSQLDCGGQFTSSANRHILEKQHFRDEARSAGEHEFENVTAVTSCDNNALDNTSNLSLVMSSNSEPVTSGNSKRPFGEDENLQIVAKRARQTDVTAADEFKSNSYLQADARFDPQVRLSFFPGYFEDYLGPIEYSQVEETQSRICHYLPRKLVAMGPDHQAEIPVWRAKTFLNSPEATTSYVQVINDEDSTDRWIAHCITTMPDSSSLGCRTDCHCLDKGSIRCVRQHVMEAREELRSTLGHERFVELGLGAMGEDVALGWTEVEEQLFSKVVISNPASMGKNFWDDLPRCFPSRSKKELISYYLNVFMLRKRGDVNIHDEAGGDECDDDEFGTSKSNFGPYII